MTNSVSWLAFTAPAFSTLPYFCRARILGDDQRPSFSSAQKAWNKSRDSWLEIIWNPQIIVTVRILPRLKWEAVVWVSSHIYISCKHTLLRTPNQAFFDGSANLSAAEVASERWLSALMLNSLSVLFSPFLQAFWCDCLWPQFLIQ